MIQDQMSYAEMLGKPRTGEQYKVQRKKMSDQVTEENKLVRVIILVAEATQEGRYDLFPVLRLK
jgi:hypothetical protein